MNATYLRSLDPQILQESGDLGSRFLLISVTFTYGLTLQGQDLVGILDQLNDPGAALVCKADRTADGLSGLEFG